MRPRDTGSLRRGDASQPVRVQGTLSDRWNRCLGMTRFFSVTNFRNVTASRPVILTGRTTRSWTKAITDTASPQKQSGSLRVARGPRFRGMATSKRWRGTDKTATTNLTRWRNRTPTTGAFSTCWGTSGDWCQDWFAGYESITAVDPCGPEEGKFRVIRGGSWGSDSLDVRAAVRSLYTPADADNRLGFRIVRKVED